MRIGRWLCLCSLCPGAIKEKKHMLLRIVPSFQACHASKLRRFWVVFSSYFMQKCMTQKYYDPLLHLCTFIFRKGTGKVWVLKHLGRLEQLERLDKIGTSWTAGTSWTDRSSWTVGMSWTASWTAGTSWTDRSSWTAGTSWTASWTAGTSWTDRSSWTAGTSWTAP